MIVLVYPSFVLCTFFFLYKGLHNLSYYYVHPIFNNAGVEFVGDTTGAALLYRFWTLFPVFTLIWFQLLLVT